MTDITKIELSTLELELMNNSEWILTKHRVIEKISLLFSSQITGIDQKFAVSGVLFEELLATSPKISKGERYQNLPYVILDYPALFSKEAIFALRTMFLWGNFISVTLHLSGKYKNALQQKIINKIDFEIDNQYLGIGENQWQQHFSEESYVPINATDKSILNEYISKQSFLKIALRFKLDEVTEMDKNIKQACQYLAGLL